MIVDDTSKPKKPTTEAWEDFKTLRGCMKVSDDYDFEADKEAYLKVFLLYATQAASVQEPRNTKTRLPDG